MKKYIFTLLLIVSSVGANADTKSFVPKNEGEVLIYEQDWQGVEYPEISEFPEYNLYESTDEGLAITNPIMQEYPGSYPYIDTNYGYFSLEQGHEYIVRLTLKIPSDGTYYVNMGSWVTNFSHEVPVTASKDWQEIDVEFHDFVSDTETVYDLEKCHITLFCGWVVGTTIVQKVQVIENTKGGETAIKAMKASMADGTMYNIAGQRVNASYKGIVIQNGKKRIVRKQ